MTFKTLAIAAATALTLSAGAASANGFSDANRQLSLSAPIKSVVDGRVIEGRSSVNPSTSQLATTFINDENRNRFLTDQR